MSVRKNKNLARRIHIFLLAGAMAFVTAAPVYAIPTNTQLPIGGSFGSGSSGNIQNSGNIMNITQNQQNAVIKWQDFSIGADATVNFKGLDNNQSQFNTLNYINSGNVSEIYGQINAQNGNIYIVNTAGVQIGGSAQINVGSLYVSNKKMEDTDLSNFYANGKGTPVFKGSTTNAELMSLGGIVTEGNVTFDGDRVVIDVDHLYQDTDGTAMDTANQLTIKTTDADNVVLGYTAYDEKNKTYENAANKNFEITQNKNGNITEEMVKGYMWVENLLQLQAMETNLSGNYALRNSIDANFSADSNYNYAQDKNNAGKGFASIGNSTAKFTGNFDGLGYDIFDLNVKGSHNNAGLFGYVDGAIIRNFTLNSGSVTGGKNTGAAVGSANNSTISNIINTADVTGTSNVGGLVGSAQNSKLDGLINTGTVTGTDSNIGGIAGNITGSSITGETYNLGAVKGSNNTFNVGGIVGSAKASIIGNAGEDAFVIYNELNVTGGYNVGGIAGQITGSDTNDDKTMVVQNVANEGAVLAEGAKEDAYYYHTASANAKNDTGADNYDSQTGIVTIEVKVANAGGIVGNADNASVSNAENSGDVTTSTTTPTDDKIGTYYNAGNVGGIVGRAENTNITTVVNKENNVAGAHNVGGAVGYLTGNSTISGAINNSGDITATAARRTDNTGFAQESIRNYEDVNQKEIFNIGNIGGIVGYMYGDNTQIANSANRGTVHSAYIDKEHLNNVLTISKAANVGGIVGKLDTNKKYSLSDIKNNVDSASITGSYNTGDVQGYTGVGGVIGFMYNGSVAESYNLGTIKTTRKASTSSGSQEALNMGGIVGDSTEGTDAHVVIYDVYNTGKIGDETFNLYGRHIGGIVGRLSGSVEKAYNTGDIYNGFNVVGGIVGYWYAGTINNTFNTGNITVVNNNDAASQVGGIVGAADLTTSSGDNAMSLSNSYNLGTLRSFKPSNNSGNNTVGGIIGFIANWNGSNSNKLTIDGVYTLGNIYAANKSGSSTNIAAIVGKNHAKMTIGNTGAFYITPEDDSFTTLITAGTTNENGVHSIAYNDRYKLSAYNRYTINGKTYTGFSFSSQESGSGDIIGATNDNWRIYAVYDDNNNLISGTTPILNAFLPKSEEFFSNSENMKDISSIQYGTAYNPLLTIINTDVNADLQFDWSKLGISGAGGLAVYGNDSLTLNGFTTSGANTYFGGTIYSDGALNLNGTGANFNLGSGSKLYGSSVTLDAENGDMTVYGSVTSTDGDITINGDDIEIIGKLTAVKQGEQTTIAGISSKPASMNAADLNDPDKPMQSITDRFAHTTNGAKENGNITVTASGTAEVLYGHLGTGNVTSGGSLTVKGNDSVYIDTDLHIGGNLNLTSDGEMLIDLSNMGDISKENLHKEFLDHFKTQNSGGKGAEINISGSDDFKITIDLWDEPSNSFKLDKYDVAGNEYEGATNHKLTDDIKNLNVNVNGQQVTDNSHTYIWIDSAEQLQGIQDYYTKNDKDEAILGYNFALKNDIDASALTGYEAIGTGSDNGFTGILDGRNNRIIGLTVGKKDANGGSTSNTPASVGIFATVGQNGIVKDLGIYSSNFYGMDYAGAVAGINNGTITGVTTLGNHVEAFGSENSLQLNNTTGSGTVNVGAAGGIAGINYGNISDISASDSIIAGDSGSGGGLSAGILATAGGIAGINEGDIENVTADSAITANQSTTYSLGGITGFNRNGSIDTAYNTGVTHGEYGDGNITSNSVGGIAGVNTGSISNVYNSADITGGNYVGGIVGYNHKITNNLGGQIPIPEKSGQISNAVNAGDILADFTYDDDGVTYNYKHTGGLAGYNSGSISRGRNTGEIYGGKYVGGMVGANQVIKDDNGYVIKGSGELSNLSNSVFATITGESYVGGIAGQNYGNINATESAINNYGKVYGQHFVGGIAGANEEKGIIKNTISSISLYVKNPETVDDKDNTNNPSFFGGVVGKNSGIINGATNASSVDVAAAGATYVGGIIGQNTETGSLQGKIANEGTVSGLANVGGIIGENINASILYNNDSKERLQITNSGNVSATEGGAAGIFYKNNITGHEDDINANAINNADITNTGTVTGGTDENSVTGGLFGYNSGNITNSTLTNSGIVTGGGTVGGLIGENTGNISTSSLKNEAGATVIGINNVGGLIGKNTGTITGGRTNEDGTEADYYKYQIYNNGVINVGTWNDGNNNGIVDAGEIGALTDTVTSTNIGGLIGSNEGNLTAGYNTGAINASSSSNVGGIVGNNAGTVDQVFNTVMTADDSQAAAITGSTNVGGIIGSNSGELSNAYNTTAVSGNAVVGNIVGENTGKISGVLDVTNEKNSLVGNNTNNDTVETSYSISEKDSNTSGITVIQKDAIKNESSYSNLAANGKWKFYDGSQVPLLSVFLTKISINQDKLDSYMSQHKIYNTKEQQLTSDDIKALINLGAIYVDGLTKEEAFAAFYNNNGLISSTEHKDAGSYSDWLYSGQIASSGRGDTFNPNNLGYDIDLTASIAKAQIIVDLNDIERTYGTTITNDNYGFNYDFSNVKNEEDKNTLRNELNGKLTMQQVNTATDDGALIENGTKTNDAGDYTWTGTVNIADGYQGNYEFVLTTDQAGDNQSSLGTNGTTITTIGGSKVKKLQLSISDIIANIVYGNQDGKGFTVSGGELSNIVYDDDVKLDTNLAVTNANIVSGSNYATNKGNRYTADVGTYENSLKYTGLGLTGNDANNYYIADTATGTIKVTQATIKVDLDDVNRIYGNTDITSGGYNVVNNIQGIVNNDTYNRYDFTVTVAKDNALTGNTSGKVTQDVGTYNYTGKVTGSDYTLNQNYKIVVNNSASGSNVGTGKSIINKAELSIIIDNVSTTYGTAFDETKYSYNLGGLVNDDQFDDVSGYIDAAAGGYNNNAAGSDGKATQNAGDSYSLSFNNDITNKDILKNYNITTVDTGKSTITKKQVTISADNVQINLGQKPNYTGTDINGVLVNGDKFNNDYHYGVKDSAIENTVGTHVNSVGIWIGNSFYELSEGYHWTGSGMDTFFSNYDIPFTPGTLTVGEKVDPDYNWSYLYNDNPFDRFKNFRERKAEINFVDGGMEI